jgi:hypothetical protein
MIRRVAVSAGVALTFLASTGCEEAHRWGARMRGAPIVDYGEPGGPTWYTGHATKGSAGCYAEGRRLGVAEGTLQVVCEVFYPWVEGARGYVG